MRIGLVAAIVWITAALAQEPEGLSIRVDVKLVNVAFIVRDSAGALERALTKDDVEVFEDGVRQDVRFFGRSSDLPLRLALAADVSGSQHKFIKAHQRDIERFLKSALTPKDLALMLCFGNHLRVVSDFSSSAEMLVDGLERFQKKSFPTPELDVDLTRSGGTALFDAVYALAEEKLGNSGGERKAIVLFSDGEDNASAHDLMDAIERAQAADALIYTVRYTEGKPERLPARARYGIREMDRLAKETGGAAFDASEKSVGKALAQVSEELRSLYDVGYVSSNLPQDRGFRKVVIRVKRSGATVRSKPGYFIR